MDAAYLRERSARYRAQADAVDDLLSRAELLRMAERFLEIAAAVDRRLAEETLARSSSPPPADQRSRPLRIATRLLRWPRSGSPVPSVAPAGIVQMWSAALTALGMTRRTGTV